LYGDWFLLNGSLILCAYSNDGFRKSREKMIVPLWQIHDCISWFNERGFYLRHLVELQHDFLSLQEVDEGKWHANFIRPKKKPQGYKEVRGQGKTPLEAVLKPMVQLAKAEKK